MEPCVECYRLLVSFTEAVDALSLASDELAKAELLHDINAFEIASNRRMEAQKRCAGALWALEDHRLEHGWRDRPALG